MSPPPILPVAHVHPAAGPPLLIAAWIVQLLIAYLIYRDAREQKMLAPAWTILAFLPLFGFLADALYLILREIRVLLKTDRATASL